MFSKLNQLEKEFSEKKLEILEEIELIKNKKLKELGLSIGDIITNGRTKGILKGVVYSFGKFRFNANAIKKDGTESKNSAGMWCTLDEVKKL